MVYSAPPRYVAGLPRPSRTLVMGVVNVTPDSFSDGGMWLEPTAAIAHGLELLADGADLVDVGGESTRPGAERPSVEEELARVIPVLRALAAEGAVVSVDTMRSDVARRAVDAGASVVNDVSGGRADPAMLATVAALDVPFVCMHWRGHAVTMQAEAAYDDVVTDVVTELRQRVKAAEEAGIAPDRMAIDPGLGFAKTGAHNWTLLRRLEELHQLGCPVLVGSSRKAFLGALLADEGGQSRPAVDRDDASAALSTLAALAGAWCVRVHDVRRSLDAVKVAARWGEEPGSTAEVGPMSTDAARVEEVLAAHAAFYAAFERSDFDAMEAMWADDEGVVCVHPGAEPIRGRSAVMRSWLALMAGAPYIQFFLTDVRASVVGDLASVTCTENVLSAGADTPVGVFAGGSAAATNVLRYTSQGWRLWIHHASPVLSSTDARQEESP